MNLCLSDLKAKLIDHNILTKKVNHICVNIVST